MHTKPVLTRFLADACAHRRAGRGLQAAQCCRRILSLIPLHAQANAMLGALLLDEGHAELAIPFLRRARNAQPDVLQNWLQLFAALRQHGGFDKGPHLLREADQFALPQCFLEQLAKVLGEPPQDRQQGMLDLYEHGDYVGAEIAAWLFIDDYPAHPLGWQILGAVLHANGNLDDALDLNRQTAERFPDDASAQNNLAFTLLALGQYEAALTAARRALFIDPAHASARNHAAKALAHTQAPAEEQAARSELISQA